MKGLPKLDETAIRARIDARSFERGEKYFRSGAIFDTKRQGRTIKARCEGSMAGPYRLHVTFDPKGKIAEAECSCPVGDGGFCKHVAALLLTWRAKPGEFVEVEDLDAALERRSKPELVALIKQMLRREPDLEILLETPLPGPGTRRMPVSPDTYRRQAAAAFRGYDYEYGSGYGVARDLDPILEIGSGFLAQGDPASASAVYEGVLDAVVDHYETIDDEGGDLHAVASRCASGLARCLAGVENAARRAAILQALVGAFDFIQDYGGDTEEDIPSLIAAHATAEERRTVAGWVRQTLGELRSDDYSRYRRAAYGEFLLELEQDRLGDEDYLRLCRESGLTADLVDRLLALGRLDEAVRELEQADDMSLLSLADVFVSRKQAAVAERVVRSRAGQAKGYHVVHMLEWLKRRAAARRDRAAVRELTEAIFRKSPSFEGYKQLRKLAGKEAGWPALRAGMLEALQQAHRPDEVIRIYLDEGEIDQALEAVQAERRPRPAYGYAAFSGSGMRMEVAKAAEASRPRAAREIYRAYAEDLISARGRENYKEACRHLKKVQELDTALGEPSAWSEYVAALREQHRALRAFQEELRAARL